MSPRWLALLASGVLLAGLIAAGACAPIRAFDAIVPTDPGIARIAHDVPYGAAPRQTLDIYAPRAAATLPARRPMIVFLYGGSWQSGEKAGYGWLARALAAQGFVTVVPDYRLVPGVRFPLFVEDCAAALKWARAHAADYHADPDRIVLIGHSAGAYNAAMLALDPRFLGADRAGVRGFAGIAGPYDFLPLDGPITQAAFGTWARPAETQPISYAAAGAPPALLLHGAEDTTVWPRNSQRLAARLREAGVDAQVKIYPKLGHIGIVTAIARPFRRKAPVLADLAAFAHRVTAP